ncbi:phospholipase D-like domain-containing protein [Enterobacteriaceae endosymbiont of Plateumaris braccata]|uniref:phospholipase D-like domain-containing protein n=1 Tax=Enterobacteriaceae endosymbiont of Plateumaris braccata TaxID=2675793 RepID=UPI001449A570|nr:phospholipase D-like domain-containing protein [Enterobacteriaceae endosymbiont of Plateumaris braccata]QJC28288.1 DUF1669 domain-containing protein [Enterobacteriaceae endosymbiont of Plateumaris braccata]
MNTKKIIILLILILLKIDVAVATRIDVLFTPNPKTLPIIIKLIEHAKKEILVAAYTFTNKNLALALLNASHKGIKIYIMVDAKNNMNRYTAINFLKNKTKNIHIRMNNHYAIMHNKFIIIDGSTIETGSLNYSANAIKRNAENIIIIYNSKKIAKIYKKQFFKLWKESIIKIK